MATIVDTEHHVHHAFAAKLQERRDYAVTLAPGHRSNELYTGIPAYCYKDAEGCSSPVGFVKGRAENPRIVVPGFLNVPDSYDDAVHPLRSIAFSRKSRIATIGGYKLDD